MATRRNKNIGGPVKKKSPAKVRGNPVKKGHVFGNPQKGSPKK